MKVVVFWTNRAEAGLLTPVIAEMQKLGIEVLTWNKENAPLNDMDFKWMLSTVFTGSMLYMEEHKPDLVFASFDRPEMLMVAQAAHYLNIPIAQLHAGDVSAEGCWDDRLRWSISALADLLFCNGDASFSRVHTFIAITTPHPNGRIEATHTLETGDEGSREIQFEMNGRYVYEVGSTAFDDVEVEEGWIRGKEIGLIYTGVIYNPPTTRPELIKSELDSILKWKHELPGGTHLIWVGPNGDPGSDLIIKYAKNATKHDHYSHYFDNLPRPKFLALLKKADYLIGNSSSLFLEAPALRGNIKGIIHIGVRNRGREYIVAHTGGSKRIAEIIKKYLEERKYHD